MTTSKRVTPCSPSIGDRRAVALGEEGDEDVGALELALAGALDVRRRPLHGAVEAEREGGKLSVRLLRHGLELVVEELLELLLQRGAASAAGVADDGRRLVIEEERVEQVLDRDVLVPPPRRLALGEGEGDLDFGADAHVTRAPR